MTIFLSASNSFKTLLIQQILNNAADQSFSSDMLRLLHCLQQLCSCWDFINLFIHASYWSEAWMDQRRTFHVNVRGKLQVNSQPDNQLSPIAAVGYLNPGNGRISGYLKSLCHAGMVDFFVTAVAQSCRCFCFVVLCLIPRKWCVWVRHRVQPFKDKAKKTKIELLTEIFSQPHLMYH